MTILGHFSEWSFKNWPFLAKGGVLEQKAYYEGFHFTAKYILKLSTSLSPVGRKAQGMITYLGRHGLT